MIGIAIMEVELAHKIKPGKGIWLLPGSAGGGEQLVLPNSSYPLFLPPVLSRMIKDHD